MKNEIRGRKAIIVFHEATTGPGHDLRDFLLENGIGELLFVAHPLVFLPENFKKSSRFEFYKNGKLIEKKYAVHYSLPEPLLYIKDFLYTIFWSFKIRGVVDLFFGLGNLNAFAGLILRLLGKTRQSIYYVIDYIPNRFKNIFLNYFYQYIEKVCAFYSDWTWNLSPRMIEERNKKWKKKFPNQLVVLHGVHFKRIKRVPYSRVNRWEIIYMGGLLKKQGVQYVLQAMPLILEKIPKAKFTIIGGGQYENELKKLVGKLHLEKQVEFAGYVPDHKEVENRIAKAAIAVAIYQKDPDNFTYYTDPGKVKNYLGGGVPVLITDVPHIARVVESQKCGIIVSTDRKKLAEKLTWFLQNEEMIKQYRINALKFAKKYDWDKVFEEALSYVFK